MAKDDGWFAQDAMEREMERAVEWANTTEGKVSIRVAQEVGLFAASGFVTGGLSAATVAIYKTYKNSNAILSIARSSMKIKLGGKTPDQKSAQKLKEKIDKMKDGDKPGEKLLEGYNRKKNQAQYHILPAERVNSLNKKADTAMKKATKEKYSKEIEGAMSIVKDISLWASGVGVSVGLITESNNLDSLSDSELSARGLIRVPGYTRKDGVKVDAHYRKVK